MPVVTIMYDALIIGGGPAGLSAAVYLGRFTRKVLVLDGGAGRSSFAQVNENYLGFPEGITTRELRELGRKQAERFGVHFKECRVDRIEHVHQGEHGDEPHFSVFTTEGDYQGRTLLFATGVTDVWPHVEGIERFIGKQVFWCITCDGFRCIGCKILCFGNTDEAAATVLQMTLFSDDITLVADPELARFSETKLTDLATRGIRLLYAKPERLELSDDGETVDGVCLDNGEVVACDKIFALLGVRPNTGLARDLGLELDEEGYIVMDEEGYTTVAGAFAAGDLTRMYSQQVASAVHAGAEAAQTMNYYLYAPFQKNPGYDGGAIVQDEK